MKKYRILLILAVLGFVLSCSKDGEMSSDPKSPSDGKAGSTARIVIKGDYLYAVDNTSLKVVDISTPTNPTYINTVNIGLGIETIYPFKDYLFIGSNIGMYIYGLTDPANPNQLSEFEHITSCDPVIANDSLAFVTLRNNEVCNRWMDTRQIDIIDIKSVTNPYLIRSYITVDYPYGLDMLDSLIFVCHGTGGVWVYDYQKMINGVSNPVVSKILGINAFDAIIYQGNLFVIGESGFYQYDYSNINNIKLISSILKNQ